MASQDDENTVRSITITSSSDSERQEAKRHKAASGLTEAEVGYQEQQKSGERQEHLDDEDVDTEESFDENQARVNLARQEAEQKLLELQNLLGGAELPGFERQRAQEDYDEQRTFFLSKEFIEANRVSGKKHDSGFTAWIKLDRPKGEDGVQMAINTYGSDKKTRQSRALKVVYAWIIKSKGEGCKSEGERRMYEANVGYVDQFAKLVLGNVLKDTVMYTKDGQEERINVTAKLSKEDKEWALTPWGVQRDKDNKTA